MLTTGPHFYYKLLNRHYDDDLDLQLDVEERYFDVMII